MNRITQAFAAVSREYFVPDDVRDYATVDTALPIGYGQTISQPSTVRRMLEWLAVRPGDKVLDVGSGSGWTTALLSYIVGSRGSVFAVERIPALLAFGQSNCQRLNIGNVQFFQAGKTYGLPAHAPYDRILVSAAAGAVPDALIDQLKAAGKMVIPVGSAILEITKTSIRNYDVVTHDGFVFVPLL